jgi:predicted RNase H-like HicB family nuclease
MKKRTLTASVWKEGNWYVAQCLEVDIASQGRTKKQALQNLAEAVELHFQEPVATITPEVYKLEVELSAA